MVDPIISFRDGEQGITTLNGPTGMIFSEDTDHLYLTAYYDHAVNLFDWDSSQETWNHTHVWVDESDGIWGMRNPRDVILDPSIGSTYVAASGSDALAIFSADQSTGALSFIVTAANGDDRVVGLDGIRSLALAGDGHYLYSASSNDDAIAFFRWEGQP